MPVPPPDETPLSDEDVDLATRIEDAMRPTVIARPPAQTIAAGIQPLSEECFIGEWGDGL